MQVRSLVRRLPEEPSGEIELKATHYNNAVILQIRFNGELDSTYEVSSLGLTGPLALDRSTLDGDDEVTDHLSDYKVVTRLGDSDDPKMDIVCTQIAELYRRVIGDNASNVVISLSRKLWSGRDSNDKDFAMLVFLLQCIKDMYIN